MNGLFGKKFSVSVRPGKQEKNEQRVRHPTSKHKSLLLHRTTQIDMTP
jgi:hypothetical protein